MMLENKKILITGATGFVGSNLVRRLADLGTKVFIFVRKDSLLWRIDDIKDKFRINIVDITDENRLKHVVSEIMPDGIIHSAVYGGYPFQKDWKKIFDINLTGTVNVLNACKEVGFEFFINTGSSSEYGIKDTPIKETDMLDPVTAYGVAKASASLYCSFIAKTESLPITTLRLFSPYGYYEDRARLVPYLILSALRGELPCLSSSKNVRDFIFIDDVVEAYLKAIENIDKIKGEIINIGSGEQHTVSELVEKVMQLIGSQLMPVWDAVANSRKEPKCWQADIAKSKKLLNWYPETSLSEGLRKTVKWFEKNKGLLRHYWETESCGGVAKR
ncbi:MAG: dTDP-glucose 4,6-dehydratase 2 [Elusimicrobia bacterium ADurb.Bin231]|nr:MAG: dTDP-glucose 4,6-dehydratase 2 [Elusimicrobia bacterium ADurb.Bin231]